MLRRFIELLFYDYEEEKVIIEKKFFLGSVFQEGRVYIYA